MIAKVDGLEVDVEIEVVSVSEVQNINGSREAHVIIRPVIISGPGGDGGGEPLPVRRAA
jgi:hypothetical protein